MPPNRILVATDGSPNACRAVDLAAELSAALGTDLSIVHVLMHGRPAEEIERMAEIEHLIEQATPRLALMTSNIPGSVANLLAEAETQARGARLIEIIGETTMEQAVERAKAGGAMGIRTHLAHGDFADEILEAADADTARMIVLGCRGLGKLQSAVLGSVSQKVAHRAPCTVVIAK